MSESKRQQKYSRMLQKDLGDIFQRNIQHKFKNAFITVTGVRMSPDLSVAKIDLSILMTEGNKQQVMDDLNDAKGEIRGILGRKIGKQVRHIPELIFYLNEGAEYASKMDAILSNLNIPPASDEEE